MEARRHAAVEAGRMLSLVCVVQLQSNRSTWLTLRSAVLLTDGGLKVVPDRFFQDVFLLLASMQGKILS